ncbi:MAG: hypothetical protein NW217_00215 [Hyphomicrobiaceae bacterium]|nr:hypothetical protein [Hyphomicrobiaceae bacterium]
MTTRISYSGAKSASAGMAVLLLITVMLVDDAAAFQESKPPVSVGDVNCLQQRGLGRIAVVCGYRVLMEVGKVEAIDQGLRAFRCAVGRQCPPQADNQR